MGTGIVAPNMFPAKYNFDINAAPNCANDYVVFGLNVAGATPGQANLVGVNNLYSGSTPRLCLANPTVNFAYNGSTAGGSVLTSPADFTGWQENRLCGEHSWNYYLPRADLEGCRRNLSHGCRDPDAQRRLHRYRCCPTSSCLKSVTFSTTATDTLSSPWVDYQTDKAFVGGDDGKIYRISCVFNCALNTNPTVDWTFTCPWPALAVRRRNRMVPFMTTQAAASSWAISLESSGSSMPAEPAPASKRLR